MIKHRVTCPRCDRYLETIEFDGTIVIVTIKCKTCREEKEIVVRGENAQAA